MAQVAHAAAADPGEPRVATPGELSVSAFNRVRVSVDHARGIADPVNDASRTPTAEAVLGRFRKLAGEKVAWRDIVEASLKPDRSMWLSAQRREPARADLPVGLIVHALRYVANRLGQDGLDLGDYRRGREDALAEERQRLGEHGVLADLLPTAGQIEGQLGWKPALEAAGLRDRSKGALKSAGGTRRGAPPPRPQPGMPLVAAAAFYAALNGSWPSYTVLRSFAQYAGFALAAKKDERWADVLAAARELLAGEGLDVPPGDGPKPLGKGKRLTFRYPVSGIPGAPPARQRRLADGSGVQQSSRLRSRGAEVEDLRREWCVIALRVFLASRRPAERDGQRAYADWRWGTRWPAHGAFNKHGGLEALRAEARKANAEEQRRTGTPVSDATLARGEELTARFRPAKD
ncbi:MAG: hypothetical protein ACRDLD_00770, partial [Thermoleophilaceae bacterium]